jgi:hypothetical protein
MTNRILPDEIAARLDTAAQVGVGLPAGLMVER